MDFSDALIQLVYEKKLYRRCWRDDNYLKLKDDALTLNYPASLQFNLENNRFFTEEWLVEDESNGGYEDKLYPFAIALKNLKVGKKIKLYDWEYSYLKIDGLNIVVQTIESRAWFPCSEDILAIDWELHNG